MLHCGSLHPRTRIHSISHRELWLRDRPCKARDLLHGRLAWLVVVCPATAAMQQPGAVPTLYMKPPAQCTTGASCVVESLTQCVVMLGMRFSLVCCMASELAESVHQFSEQ